MAQKTAVKNLRILASSSGLCGVVSETAGHVAVDAVF